MKIGTNYSFKTQQSNNPNFGALHMPKKATLASKLKNRYMANEAEMMRNSLQDLATEFEIFINPERKMGGMVISIYKLNPVESIAKRVLECLFHPSKPKPKPISTDIVFYTPRDFGKALYQKVYEMKEALNNTPRIIPIRKLRTTLGLRVHEALNT